MNRPYPTTTNYHTFYISLCHVIPFRMSQPLDMDPPKSLQPASWWNRQESDSSSHRPSWWLPCTSASGSWDIQTPWSDFGEELMGFFVRGCWVVGLLHRNLENVWRKYHLLNKISWNHLDVNLENDDVQVPTLLFSWIIMESWISGPERRFVNEKSIPFTSCLSWLEGNWHSGMIHFIRKLDNHQPLLRSTKPSDLFEYHFLTITNSESHDEYCKSLCLWNAKHLRTNTSEGVHFYNCLFKVPRPSLLNSWTRLANSLMTMNSS